jgi:hypothetical protein
MSLFALIACSGGDPVSPADDVHFSDITITPADAIPTVLTVSFTTDAADPGWVSFGPSGEVGWRATATSTGDGSWEAVLVGLPAGTESWVTVGAGATEGPTTTLTTDAAPAWIDLLDTSEGTPTPGLLVVGVSAADGNGAAILDTQGRPVWWYLTPTGVVGSIRTRARLSPDRSEVWFNAFNVGPAGGIGDGESVLVRVAIDGSTSELVSTPYAHHDFVLHADGTLAWIDADEREIDGLPIRGDRIRERAPDGTERVVWSAWDTFTYDPRVTNDGEDVWWTMCNHLEYDATTDTYTIGARNLGVITHIDRATGTVLWTAGTQATTYATDDVFVMQHGFDVLDHGLLVFDNGPFGDLDSRAARYIFDDTTGTAALAWQYHADPAIYSFVMGDVHHLADDGVRVVFSTQGVVHEVDADGELVADFSWEPGTVIGFAEVWDSLVE